MPLELDGRLGDELDEELEELGMLDEELLGMLDELGMLGLLEDEDELELDWQPTSTTTVAPASKRMK